jgi:hypothetical protein
MANTRGDLPPGGGLDPGGSLPLPPGTLPPDTVTKDRKWEYQVFYTKDYPRHDDEFIAKINELGADGWYMLSTDDMYVYFVRELVE